METIELETLDQKKTLIEDYFKKFPSKNDIEHKFGHQICLDDPLGFIYIVRNLKSGRVYVGQTLLGVSSKTGVFKRYPHGWIIDHWSNTKVKEDVIKYGFSSFDELKVVAIGYSYEELNILEAFFMKQYNSLVDGYNLSLPPSPDYIYNKKNKKRN